MRTAADFAPDIMLPLADAPAANTPAFCWLIAALDLFHTLYL